MTTDVRDHEHHLEVLTPIDGLTGRLGLLVLRVDTDALEHEVARSRRLTWLVSLIVAVLGLVAGTLVSRRITHPVGPERGCRRHGRRARGRPHRPHRGR